MSGAAHPYSCRRGLYLEAAPTVQAGTKLIFCAKPKRREPLQGIERGLKARDYIRKKCACGKVLDCMVKRSFSLAHAGRYLALLLIAFCWFTAPASASGTAHNNAASHFLRAGVAAVADLDGDHIPDIASGVNTGRTSAGYHYRVDVDLTGDATQKSFFSVFSEEPNGLNIQAIDVDGDHDLDLVITSRLSRRPIGVWINDGTGSFTPGNLDDYPASVWQTPHSIDSPQSAPQNALQYERRDPQTEFRGKSADFPSCVFQLSGVLSSSPSTSQTSIGFAQLRAPPASSI
jgi:hypothetical protein